MPDLLNQYVTVEGYSGIAFFVDDYDKTWNDYSYWGCPECFRSDDCECPDVQEEDFLFFEGGEWVDDQRAVLCHMVGDDAEWIFDVDDLTIIDPDDVCSCGQIGCWSPNEMSGE